MIHDKHNFVIYEEKVFPDLYDDLIKEIKFEDEELIIFGKKCIPKRKTCAFGDDGKTFSYSGKERKANPYTYTIKKIKDELEKKTGYTFNYVLAQYYSDGEAMIGYHGDAIKDMQKPVIIASVTFNEEKSRTFIIKNDEMEKKIKLRDGSLLLMHGTKIQTEYKHGIPAEKKIKTGRINLTFRQIEN